jgi:hypothetical protein
VKGEAATQLNGVRTAEQVADRQVVEAEVDVDEFGQVRGCHRAEP